MYIHVYVMYMYVNNIFKNDILLKKGEREQINK